MVVFKRFENNKNESIPVPGAFFNDLLPVIENMDELRLTLYAFWYLHGQPAEPRFMRQSDLLKDARLMQMLGKDFAEQQSRLQQALDLTVERGSLLRAGYKEDSLYFLHTERGAAAHAGLMQGAWNPDTVDQMPIHLQPERPNIYALYEQNIGPLTPLIAETLLDAENTYPLEWIEDALRMAVIKNVRNWKYVEAILASWKEKGRDGTNKRSTEENRPRDSEGKFADFINR